MPSQDREIHLPMTRAEVQVLQWLAHGCSNEEIAESLDVRIDVVISRLRRFHDRTGLSGRSAVAWAVRHEDCCLSVNSLTAAH